MPKRLTLALLALILISGFAFRVWNLNFDQGIGSHPDERSTVCFHAIDIALPESWAQFLDPQSSPLNPLWNRHEQQPRSFTYGHFPLYLGVAMGHAFEGLAPLAGRLGVPAETLALMQRGARSCDALAVAGRLTIALLDSLTILLLFLLGRSLFGAGAGLLAAAFYAYTVQAIQLSHFFAMDPASTSFVVLAVLGGVAMMRRQAWSVAAATGLACGLAIASKFSALPVLAVPAVAAILFPMRARACLQPTTLTAQARPGEAALWRVPALIALAWTVALLSFLVTSPYAILDWGTFSRAVLLEQGQMVRGLADFPFTRQYRNTLPYLYFIQQQLQWGLGWPLGLVAFGGALYALWRLLATSLRLAIAPLLQRRRPHRTAWLSDANLGNLLMWSWVLPYFLITGAFLAKFNRYMSPLLPFLVLWGAWLILVLWKLGKPGPTLRHAAPQAPPGEALESGRLPVHCASDTSVQRSVLTPASPVPRIEPGWLRPIGRATALVLALTGLLGGLGWSLAYVKGVYGSEHTWITASRWIYLNVPRDAVILWEQWDDPLPKTIPGEPGMDMHSRGLRHIDWGPYEEDTAAKYARMKQALAEADYVVYSSKRIYDSVDELPERYPMTNRYYAAMRDGRLGFELVQEVTSPPRLFGVIFDDRHADESFSLYDHPQVSIYRKVRPLSDEAFAELFAGSWEDAIHYHRGRDSPLSPVFEALGLGQRGADTPPGALQAVRGWLGFGGPSSGARGDGTRPALALETPIRDLPPVDDYRWNRLASESALLATLWWWLVLSLLGWLSWPLLFRIARPLRDGGFWLSRGFGWLLAGWLLWILSSLGALQNRVEFAWLTFALVAAAGLLAAYVQRRALGAFLREGWRILLLGELLFALAYLGFVWIRLHNPDLWQPWFGGEKPMEFAFLNGILRSAHFPPLDPHFAGGYINYYYYGLYQVAYLIKLTGLYAEVAFNLAIPTLFALTLISVFAIAYSAVPLTRTDRGSRPRRMNWRHGFGAALLAPLLVMLIGNLEGFAQWARRLAALSPDGAPDASAGLIASLAAAFGGFRLAWDGAAAWPAYDFWGPSRVIAHTINEFPYWSFLFADLHPHLISLQLGALFIALLLVLLQDARKNWRDARGPDIARLLFFTLLLGAIASVNLWDLPTYFGLGMLAFVISQYRGQGRIDWTLTLWVALITVGGASLLFWPFFTHYVAVAVGGLGLVKAPDDPGQWLLIWGVFFFILLSWTLAQLLPHSPALHGGSQPHPDLFGLKVADLVPVALLLALLASFAGWDVLSYCLAWLGLAAAVLWRRDLSVDAGAALAGLLTFTGLAILAGTQLFYIKDFLQGGDLYRMNTVFKFFIQVWLLWGLAAAIAVPRLFAALFAHPAHPAADGPSIRAAGPAHRDVARMALRARLVRLAKTLLGVLWVGTFLALLLASLTFPLLGTQARLEQRMPGWQPAIGTLKGLDFMREGSFNWPTHEHPIALRPDWLALQWLLEHARDNAVILESSEVDYYRAWGTRIATHTGLSGLNGLHTNERRFPEEVEARARQHRQLWESDSIAEVLQLLDTLAVDLIYVGQLERFLHPSGAARFDSLHEDGLLEKRYENERVVIYGVPAGRTR